jgi:hypothetical protein
MEGAGEAGFPVAALAAVLVLAAIVLAIALFAPDPVLAGRVLSFAAFLGALSAAVVSFMVLALRGPAMDPLAGVALMLATPGFALASLGWLLDVTGVDATIGPLALSKLLWYTSSLIIMWALYELGAAARWLAGGLKPRETAIAVAVPAVYVAPFAVLLWRIQAPLTRIAETVASAAFLTLSLLALLPIARRRFSWGLALMCSGSTSFIVAVPLTSLVTSIPLSNALYALSFVMAAAGLHVYGVENPIVRSEA